MVKVLGYWDVWFQHRESEYDISWRFMLKHFGVEEIILIPNTNTVLKLPLDFTDSHLSERDNIEEVLKDNPHLTPILVDEGGDVSLKNFKHPENVLYIFGRTGFSPKSTLPGNLQSVYIEGVDSHIGDALLHPNQACSIMLYDRMVKSWQY